MKELHLDGVQNLSTSSVDCESNMSPMSKGLEF
jgi:hypothetical protein